MPTADILTEFQHLIARVPTEASAGSTELLLQGLKRPEAQLLRRCAIPHQFGVQILGVLAPDLDEVSVGKLYEEFAKLSIITLSPDILMMHDRSRKYLFRQWLEPERKAEFAAISGRLAEFFARLADEAAFNAKESFQRRRMFHLIGFDQDRGLDDFEKLCRERRYELRLTECESVITLVHEYDAVLTPDNRVRLAYAEGKLAADLRDWDRARALFEGLDDDSTPSEYHVKALNRLGMVHAELRKFDVAIQYFERAQDLARKKGDVHVFRTLLDLGAAERERGDLPKAEKLLNEGIALAQKAHSFFSVAVGFNSLGMLHRRWNHIRHAIRDYEQSLENLQRVGEKFRRGQVLCELGTAFAELRDWKTSEKYLLESLEIEKQAGDKHNQAITLNNLVRVYRVLGRPKEALETARQAMQLFQETRDFYRGAMATRNFAKLCRISDGSACETAFKTAIQQFRSCNEIDAAKETERELAGLARKVGLPWWAWLLIAVLILPLVYFALGIFGVIK